MELLHDGETRRKAATWDWVVRVAAVAAVPIAGSQLLLWAQVYNHMQTEPRHLEAHESLEAFMLKGDRFSQQDGMRLENSMKTWVEARFPTNVQYQYLVDRLNDLQDDLTEVKQLLKEKDQ